MYRIEVEKSGFKKLIRPDVILHVQDALAIDFEMAVGSLSDTVRVEAGAPLVNTSGTVSTVVDQTFVENIPLNGRRFQTLIMLVRWKNNDQNQSGQHSSGGDPIGRNLGSSGIPSCALRKSHPSA